MVFFKKQISIYENNIVLEIKMSMKIIILNCKSIGILPSNTFECIIA